MIPTPTDEQMERVLLDHGWEHYLASAYEDEVWLLPGRIQFEGENATRRAYEWHATEKVRDDG